MADVTAIVAVAAAGAGDRATKSDNQEVKRLLERGAFLCDERFTGACPGLACLGSGGDEERFDSGKSFNLRHLGLHVVAFGDLGKDGVGGILGARGVYVQRPHGPHDDCGEQETVFHLKARRVHQIRPHIASFSR